MAAPDSLMLGDEPSADMPAAPEASDPREAAAKAVMSALKSGNALKFADALDEFIAVSDSAMDEEMDPEMPMEDPMSPEMPF